MINNRRNGGLGEKTGIISYLAPVGRGLLGSKPGQSVEIELPEGKVSYEILDIVVAPDELMVQQDG